MSVGFSSFHGNYLKKKVHKNEWKDFWVVLKGKWLFFLKEKGAESACGILELSGNSTCIMLGQRSGKYRTPTKMEEHCEQGSDGGKGFKFKIRSKRGFHLFKSQSLSECQGWIRSISDIVKHLQDSCSVEMASALTNHSDAVNVSQEESGDGYCCYSKDDTDKSRTSDGQNSRHFVSCRSDASIRGRLRRSFRSLRVLKSEISGNAYGELQ